MPRSEGDEDKAETAPGRGRCKERATTALKGLTRGAKISRPLIGCLGGHIVLGAPPPPPAPR